MDVQIHLIAYRGHGTMVGAGVQIVSPKSKCLLGLQEAELSTWTAFLHRTVDATYNTETVIDNLHNMIGE